MLVGGSCWNVFLHLDHLLPLRNATASTDRREQVHGKRENIERENKGNDCGRS